MVRVSHEWNEWNGWNEGEVYWAMEQLEDSGGQIEVDKARKSEIFL